MRRWALLWMVAVATGCAADSSHVDPDASTEGDPNIANDSNNTDPGASETSASVDQIAASGLIDSEEAAFLTQINNYRQANGRAKLRISVALTHSAQDHSTDMATHDYFAHNSQDGTDPFTRMARAGYNYNTAKGENIAAGSADAVSAFTQWRDACDPDSAGHCTYAHRQNMLDTSFTVIGIGRANNASSTYGWYWTTDFGGYTDAVLSYGTGTIAANGGFEAAPLGTASWSSVRTRGGWYVSNAARSTSGAQTGTYAMRVNDPDPGGASATQIVLGAAGIAYTLNAASHRLSGTSNQSLYLEFLNSSYARIAVVSAAAPAGTAYAVGGVGRVAPAGTKYVRAFLYGSSAAGVHSSFTYDSVVLTAQ